MPASIFDPTQYSNLREYVEAVQGSPLDYNNPQQQNIVNAAVGAMYGGQGIAGLQSFFPTAATTAAAPAAVNTVAAAPAAVANPIEQLYTQYAGRASDPGGLQYWSNQFGADVDANERAIFQRAVAEGVAKGIESTATGANFNPYFAANPDVAAEYFRGTQGMTPADFAAAHYKNFGAQEQRAAPDVVASAPLYTKLTANSTPEEIAAAYSQFIANSGGDTEFNRNAALGYLTNTVKANTSAINTAYDRYKTDYATGIADKISSVFGTPAGSTEVPLTGIMSGFEALGRGDFTEDQARRILGADRFNQYKTVFGTETNKFVDNILADKNLSGQEAIDFVQQARKYGIDTADEFASLTGKNKELYNAIQKGYDTTVNDLVDRSLEGKTTLADRIKTGLALQSQYKLTDEDIAKAADLTVDEVKANLDPVRNFADQFKTATAKADATGKDILSFLETAKKSAPVAAVYGTNLDALEQKINAANEKWKGYGVDGFQAQNIYDQLNTLTYGEFYNGKQVQKDEAGNKFIVNTDASGKKTPEYVPAGAQTQSLGGKNWSGSWGGGGDNAAMAAAQKLVQKGVDNLFDLKVEKNFEKTQATGESYNGQQVIKDEDGNRFIAKTNPLTDDVTYERLPKDAKTQPMYAETVGSGDEAYTSYRPLTAEELKTYDAKTGKFDLASGNKLVDASSGKVVSKSDNNNFVLDRYSTGNFFKGKDKTMGITVTDKGVPVPYQTTERSGMVYSPVFPLLASALLPGVASALSGGIASAGGSALASGSLANTALTRGIIGGFMGEATGSGFGKGFVGGAAMPVISSGISSLLPAGMDPGMAKTITNVGTTAAASALTGRPIDWTSSLINAGVQYGAQQLPFNLTPDQLNLLGGIATPVLQGQSISPTALTGILANYALSSQKPTKGAR